jgi:hypothetical protein
MKHAYRASYRGASSMARTVHRHGGAWWVRWPESRCASWMLSKSQSERPGQEKQEKKQQKQEKAGEAGEGVAFVTLAGPARRLVRRCHRHKWSRLMVAETAADSTAAAAAAAAVANNACLATPLGRPTKFGFGLHKIHRWDG